MLTANDNTFARRAPSLPLSTFRGEQESTRSVKSSNARADKVGEERQTRQLCPSGSSLLSPLTLSFFHASITRLLAPKPGQSQTWNKSTRLLAEYFFIAVFAVVVHMLIDSSGYETYYLYYYYYYYLFVAFFFFAIYALHLIKPGPNFGPKVLYVNFTMKVIIS